MSSASSAPATKQDIAMIMNEIGKLYDANARLREEILEDVKLHFDFTVETIRHDLLGVNRDDIDSLKTRVTRLERKTGIR